MHCALVKCRLAVSCPRRPPGRHQAAFVRTDTDHAIWRRLCLVPFTVTIPADERDPALADKLRDEAPGILAWCVRGCVAWQREGLAPAAAIRLATNSYKADEDRLGEFLEMKTESGEFVAVADLHDSYSAWCATRNERPWSTKALGDALEERGFKRDRETIADRGTTRVIVGLRLKRRAP